MKLEFGLLWVEDSFSEREEEEIKTGAQQSGFRVKVTVSKDGSDLEELAAEHKKFHSFDLVLLDLNLAKGQKGDELAEKIRALFPTTSILFYSGSENEDSLRKRMADRRIEGVYCAHRRRFTDRVEELIRELSHTFDRLSGMRGLAMEVVAEVDNINKAIIAHIANGGHVELAIRELDEAVLDQTNKTMESFPALTSLEEKLLSFTVDSKKLYKLSRKLIREKLKEISDRSEEDKIRNLLSKNSTFPKEVIEIRNLLGHAREERTQDGWQIRGKSGDQSITMSDFPLMRSNFIGHLENVRALHSVLIGDQSS